MKRGSGDRRGVERAQNAPVPFAAVTDGDRGMHSTWGTQRAPTIPLDAADWESPAPTLSQESPSCQALPRAGVTEEVGSHCKALPRRGKGRDTTVTGQTGCPSVQQAEGIRSCKTGQTPTLQRPVRSLTRRFCAAPLGPPRAGAGLCPLGTQRGVPSPAHLRSCPAPLRQRCAPTHCRL